MMADMVLPDLCFFIVILSMSLSHYEIGHMIPNL